MALQTNSVTLPIGYNIISPVPLDGRTVAEYKQDLIDKAVWAKDRAYQYIGMPVYVQEDQSIYVLKEEIDYEKLLDFSNPQSLPSEEQKNELYKAWKKLASASDVESLSGVFTFKGLAEAVSPDLSYIVTCQESEGDALSPIGTAVDLEGDVYYGWQIGDQQIWTDSLVLNSASTQYTRGEGMVVTCVVYNDVYYFTTEQVADDKTILESISGHQIKVSTNDLQTTAPGRINVYDGEIIGDGYIMEYTAYSFTTGSDVSVHHSHTIIYASDGTKVVDGTTIPDNSGHVYQIGENEYASNGQIWVKLGSPVEDWIII